MHNYSFSLEPKIVKKIKTKNRLIKTAIPCKGTKEILKRLEICLIDSGVSFIKGCVIKEVLPEIKK